MKKIYVTILAILLCISLTGCKRSDYKKAVAIQESGDYESAAEIYEEIGEYEDASTRLTECRNMIVYNEALNLAKAKDFSGALVKFTELGSFKDSEEKITYCEEMIASINAFEEASGKLSEKNEAFDLAISNASETFVCENEGLEITIRPTVEIAISEAKAARVSIPEMPETATEILDVTETMNAVDYTDTIENLERMIASVNAFVVASGELSAKNDALDLVISKADEIVLCDNKALDETIRPTVETAISEAKAARVSIPEMPETATEILNVTEAMNAVDYTEIIENLNERKSILERSINQYTLVNNPVEGYVINCLLTVPGVMDISAVTEDNDPNGNLGKAGGYTAAIYFSHENVNQYEVYGDTVIEKGTDCGGQVEVYANEVDANKRNEYLATFDGTIFASGSHIVVGTCVIRTSDHLTASKQKELETNIVDALIRID